MPAYRVETLSPRGLKNLEKFSIMVEEEINEYIQNSYSLFSHQMTTCFIKED